MADDVARELEEQLRVLNEMISQQAAALTGMSHAINESSQSVNKVKDSANQLTKAQKANEQANTQNTATTTALRKTHEKYGETMQQVYSNFGDAFNSGKGALVSFAQAVLGSEEGFSKYNSTISSVGDAAFSLGRNFGILGTIVGGLFKAGTKLLEYQTRQADGLLNASDAMARMGAAGTLTTREIYEMGRGAGLTTIELEKLTKPMQSVKKGFVALAGTQTEGIKKFGQMVAVSENVRREFKRLGMGDQERNQALADFVTYINKSGTAVSGNLAKQGGLQKAALDYTRNLYALAEITGKDVETLKKERETQMATMEVALQKNKWESERVKAQKALSEAKSQQEKDAANAELKRIDREEANFERFNDELKKTNMSQEQMVAAQNMYLTGTMNRTSEKFAMWNVDMFELIRKNKAGEDVPGEIAQAIVTGYGDALNTFGQGTLALSPEAREIVGVNKELTGRTTQMIGKDFRTISKEALDAVMGNKEGTGVAAQDPALEARNDLTEAERYLKQKFDAFALEMNPLAGNMSILKILGVTAAALAAGIAAIFVGKGIVAGVKGIGKLAGFAGRGAKAAGGLFGFGKKAAETAAAAAPESASKALGGTASKELEKVAGGSSVEVFLRGLTDGLSAAGKQATNVVKGGAAIAGAIAAIGAGIAGASWILGKALPTLAGALKTFNDVKGDNLKNISKGMMQLGAGVLAMGAGKVLGALGNIIDFLVGGEEPLDKVARQVLQVQNFKFDKVKVTENTTAIVEFTRAMALVSKIGASAGLSEVSKNISDGIAAFFSNELPYQDFVEFSELDINAKKTKRNATAFKWFAEALASYQGQGSSLGAIGASIAEATTGFFGATPPFDQVVYFSKLIIDPKKTKTNATSFRLFSEALSSYKGLGSGLGAVSTALADATAKFFGVKPPLEQFVYFASLSIDPKKASVNSKAFVDFSNAMASYKGGPGLGTTISSLAGAAFGSLFGVDGPMEAFAKFANTDYGPNAMMNADALLKYSQAVKTTRENNAASGVDPTMAATSNPGTPPAPGSPNNTSSGTPGFNDSVNAGLNKGGTAGGAVVGAVVGGTKAAVNAVYNLGSSTWSAITGKGKGMEAGIKPDVLGRKAALEKDMGTKLVVTSGVRRGVANHGDGSAIDLGFRSNPFLGKSDDARNRLMANAIRLGFTGIGAEYNASGGAHIHLDTSHRYLTGWGSDGSSRSLSKDSPWLAAYLQKIRSGNIKLKAQGGGVFHGPEESVYPMQQGSEIIAPLDTSSVLMKLAKTPESTSAKTQKNAKTAHHEAKAKTSQISMNLELYNMITGKVNQMLNVLENTHSIQNKKLKHGAS